MMLSPQHTPRHPLPHHLLFSLEMAKHYSTSWEPKAIEEIRGQRLSRGLPSFLLQIWLLITIATTTTNTWKHEKNCYSFPLGLGVVVGNRRESADLVSTAGEAGPRFIKNLKQGWGLGEGGWIHFCTRRGERAGLLLLCRTWSTASFQIIWGRRTARPAAKRLILAAGHAGSWPGWLGYQFTLSAWLLEGGPGWARGSVSHPAHIKRYRIGGGCIWPSGLLTGEMKHGSLQQFTNDKVLVK